MGNGLTYSTDDKKAEYRLGQLMLYVAARCQDDPHFGALKMNKTLQKIDFLYFAQTGRPLTGAAYMKAKFGPVPQRLVPVRDMMISEGMIKLESTDRFGNPQTRIQIKKHYNGTAFDEEQLQFVDKVINMLVADNASELSDKSHNQAYYDAPELGNLIPYESIFLADDQSLTLDDYEALKEFRGETNKEDN